MFNIRLQIATIRFSLDNIHYPMVEEFQCQYNCCRYPQWARNECKWSVICNNWRLFWSTYERDEIVKQILIQCTELHEMPNVQHRQRDGHFCPAIIDDDGTSMLVSTSKKHAYKCVQRESVVIIKRRLWKVLQAACLLLNFDCAAINLRQVCAPFTYGEFFLRSVFKSMGKLCSDEMLNNKNAIYAYNFFNFLLDFIKLKRKFIY